MIQPLLKPSQQKKRRVKVASASPELAFAKGPTRREEKDAYDAEAAEWIRQMRARLFAEELRCQDCGETQEDTTRRFIRNGWAALSEHHMDEILSRAMTRGQHYSVRFSRTNVRRLCPRCHCKRHGIKVLGDNNGG